MERCEPAKQSRRFPRIASFLAMTVHVPRHCAKQTSSLKGIGILLFLLFLPFLPSCTHPTTIIEGTLPNQNYHNEWVYWTPYKDPSAKTVDSARINDDKFRIKLSVHNQNKMGFVRVKPVLRLALQEIIVYSEAGGTIQVKLDSVSNASGTPLNDVLQEWKNSRQEYDRETAALRRKNRDNKTEEINKAIENAFLTYRENVYRIVHNNKNNEAGKFIFSLQQSLFTPEQVQDFNESVP